MAVQFQILPTCNSRYGCAISAIAVVQVIRDLAQQFELWPSSSAAKRLKQRRALHDIQGVARRRQRRALHDIQRVARRRQRRALHDIQEVARRPQPQALHDIQGVAQQLTSKTPEIVHALLATAPAWPPRMSVESALTPAFSKDHHHAAAFWLSAEASSTSASWLSAEASSTSARCNRRPNHIARCLSQHLRQQTRLLRQDVPPVTQVHKGLLPALQAHPPTRLLRQDVPPAAVGWAGTGGHTHSPSRMAVLCNASMCACKAYTGGSGSPRTSPWPPYTGSLRKRWLRQMA